MCFAQTPIQTLCNLPFVPLPSCPLPLPLTHCPPATLTSCCSSNLPNPVLTSGTLQGLPNAWTTLPPSLLTGFRGVLSNAPSSDRPSQVFQRPCHHSLFSLFYCLLPHRKAGTTVLVAYSLPGTLWVLCQCMYEPYISFSPHPHLIL